MKRSDLFKTNAEKKKYIKVEIDELNKCQQEIASLDEQANSDKIQVVKRYNQLKQPQFEKRSDLLIKLKKFWRTALENHPTLTYDIVGVEGQDCLDYLQNITLEDEEGPDSSSYTFIICFYFNCNPYFFNEFLWKKFTISIKGERSSKISDIEWKERMELNTESSDGENNRKRKASINSRFIEWFNDINSHHSSVIADAIRDEIWQNPSTYYNASKLIADDLKRSSSVIVVEHIPKDEIIVLSSDDEMNMDENIPEPRELKKYLRKVENTESSVEDESEGGETSGSEQMSTEGSDDS